MKNSKPKFKLGDVVRISKKRVLFDKSYNINWSAEYFVIHSIFPSQPVTYSLRDLNGEVISGRFYAEEIKKTQLNESERQVYLIEKILKRDKKGLLVKWIGFSTPSYISRSQPLDEK